MAIQSQELRILVRALADPSVQMVAREMVVFIRKMQGDLRSLNQEAGHTESAFGRMARGITGFLRDVAAVAAGTLVRDVVLGAFRQVSEGVKFLARSMIEANDQVQQASTIFEVLAGSAERGGAFLEVVRQEAMRTGQSFSEMVMSTRRLIDSAEGSTKAFQKMLQITQALAALDPEQGIWGAAYALQEALSGSWTSLAQRFEFSRTEIQALKEEGLSNLEIVERLIGGEERILALTESRLKTFSGLRDAIGSIIGEFMRLAGESPFQLMTQDMKAVYDWVKNNQEAIMGLGQAIGSFLADAYRTARDALADLIGVQELSLDDVVQWGANLVASIVGGILTGIDQYLIPALISVASIIASFLAGASPPERGPLSDIDEGGERMLQAYVEGILASDAPQKVREVAEEIQGELLKGERLAALRHAVTLAQEQGARLMEAAQKRVAAAQREVEEATKRVQAAQERLNQFTRDTAEIPERFTRARRRQLEEELRAAQKEQQKKQDALKLAQEAMRAAQEQARAMVEAARKHEQAVKRQMAAEEKRLRLLEKLAKAQKEAGGLGVGITGDIEKADSKISEYAEKWKAMFEEAFAERDISGRLESIGEKFETLGGSVETIGQNAWKIASAIESAVGFAGDLKDAFDSLPSWVQDILKGVAIVVGINLATGGMVSAILTALAPLGIVLATGPAAGVAALAISIAVLFKVVEANKQELWTTMQQIYGIAAFGAISLMPEGPTKEYFKKNFVQPMLDGMDESNPFIEEQAKKTFYDPVSGQVQQLAEDIVGESIIPDMIDDILDEYGRLRDEALPLIEEFAEDTIETFEKLAEFVQEQIADTSQWVVEHTGDMGIAFQDLTSDVDTLRLAIERLAIALRQLPGFDLSNIRFPTAGGGDVSAASVMAMAGALGGGGAASLNTFHINAPISLQRRTKEEFMAAMEQLWDDKMGRVVRELRK